MSAARIVVTGGAGFIGANLVDRLAGEGMAVRIFDDLSRPGVERNVVWLKDRHGALVELMTGDVRDADAVEHALHGAERVFHLAAQVAVTTSLAQPRADFEVNACGTLNVLEALRASRRPASLLYTSTNKVYGALDDVTLRPTETRHEPEHDSLRARGVGEDRALDFHSPYGCSKGAADAYVLDYARGFGLPAVVFRMSCIYGPRQFGTEDQGWVAHFFRQALRGEPITLYGDGRQVRDLLYVTDLIDAMVVAQERIARLAGCAFNLGGGVANTLSLIELLQRITRLEGKAPRTKNGQPRPGDQRYFVADTRRFRAATGWAPRVGVDEGLVRLRAWLRELEDRRVDRAEAHP